MNYHLESAQAVQESLDTSEAGLSQEEADKRLLEHGRNELEKAKKKGLLRCFAEQIINPMVLILIAAAIVSVFIAVSEGGDAYQFAEVGIILAVVLLNGILGVVQESKAEKAIEALQEMSGAVAKVRRGGVVSQIPAGELVVGDIVLIEAGDAIAADIRITHTASLKIEEAALTGESVPVSKHADTLSSEGGGVPLGDRKNMAYTGSTVAYGRGEGVVTATGMSSELGKIARFIQTAEQGETPLQQRLSQLGKILSVIVLGICVAVFAVLLIRTTEFTAETVLPSFMLAVSLAVAAIPSGLVAVVTIVLSIGVSNMSKRKAIVRRLTAVETLGCAQVICSDKTGTLTQNKMTVVDSYGDAKLLAKAMALCCDCQLLPDGSTIGDPTENALVHFAQAEGFDKNALEAELPRVAEAPFDSVRKMMTTLHSVVGDSPQNHISKQSENQTVCKVCPPVILQYTKGAPDVVLRTCSHALIDGQVMELTDERRQAILDKNEEFADRALRVLAGAFKERELLPDDISPENLEKGLTFIGLAAMIDPVRPEVKAAVDECRESGIKVVMITGDHRETAAAIARELGIITDAKQAITGRELDALSDDEFSQCAENIFVYARVQPEHKVRIVNMWRKKGYVTAMTGDGANDAPAIKSGDIGVGMGITGTDVTKNVADIVLADDNFATIVAAIEEGRRIYDNIKKTLQYLLSTNLAEVISVFTASLVGFALFRPAHLLFINLITDTIPAVALGMEKADRDIMERPPRDPKEGVFAKGLGVGIVYQGIFIALLTLASYFFVNMRSGSEYGMTAAFFTLSMCEFFQAFCLRSLRQSIFTLKTHNLMLWGAMGVSLALTLMVIYIPTLAAMFSLRPLSALELAVSFGLSALVIPIIETGKAIERRYFKGTAQ